MQCITATRSRQRIVPCRTGRAGKSGVAITFFGSEDTDVLYDLEQMIGKSGISKVPEELQRHEAARVIKRVFLTATLPPHDIETLKIKICLSCRVEIEP